MTAVDGTKRSAELLRLRSGWGSGSRRFWGGHGRGKGMRRVVYQFHCSKSNKDHVWEEVKEIQSIWGPHIAALKSIVCSNILITMFYKH